MPVEIDAKTGLPKRVIDKEKQSEAIGRLEKNRADAIRMEDDLSSEKGQMLCNLIQEHLLERIDKFVDEDPECRILKKLLIKMGMVINFGKQATDRIMSLAKQTH